MPAEPRHPPRIFCIGRNYAEHILELGNDRAPTCVVFMKPATSLVPDGCPVPIPIHLGMVHHELEMVIAIGREGSRIPASQALAYVAGVTLGIDLTLRELQAKLRQAGAPWEQSKAFDHSAPIGKLMPYRDYLDLGNIDMTLVVNGETRQSGNTRDMLWPVPELIEILSTTWRLLPGDLIFTGTPAGVGPLCAGDHVQIESPQIGRFSWPITPVSP